MRRRTLLVGAAGTVGGLAGCLASDGGQPPIDMNDDDGGDPIQDTHVETTNTDCASGDVGDATIRRDGSTVTVTGELEAPTPCHDAVLSSVRLEDDDSLHLQVDLSEREGICQQCLGVVEYEARIELATSALASRGVTVYHAGGGTYRTK